MNKSKAVEAPRSNIAITEEALRNNPSATLTTTAAPAEAPQGEPDTLLCELRYLGSALHLVPGDVTRAELACRRAAARIESLSRDNADLVHDIGRAQAASSELATDLAARDAQIRELETRLRRYLAIAYNRNGVKFSDIFDIEDAINGFASPDSAPQQEPQK